MVSVYLIYFIKIFANILIFALFARVVLSWMRVNSRGFLVSLIVESTEPILRVFRRIIPPIGGVLDLSPIFAFFAIDLLRSILIQLLA